MRQYSSGPLSESSDPVQLPRTCTPTLGDALIAVAVSLDRLDTCGRSARDDVCVFPGIDTSDGREAVPVRACCVSLELSVVDHGGLEESPVITRNLQVIGVDSIEGVISSAEHVGRDGTEG